MNSIKTVVVALLVVLCTSWTTSDSEVIKPNKAEEKLAVLLKGYQKMTRTKVFNQREVLQFNKKQLVSKKLLASKVAVIEYATKGKKTRKVYALEIEGELMFQAYSRQYGKVVTYEADEEECEIIVDSCGGDECSCYCVVSNSCDPSGESDPNCCDSCSCEEDDGIHNDFDNFLETLMP